MHEFEKTPFHQSLIESVKNKPNWTTPLTRLAISFLEHKRIVNVLKTPVRKPYVPSTQDEREQYHQLLTQLGKNSRERNKIGKEKGHFRT